MFTIDDSKNIDHILGSLTKRERQILERRFGLYDSRSLYDTLQSIGNSFGLTRERIRQIEQVAFRKMRHPTRIRKLDSMITTIDSASDKAI
jgi:RNA polymerase primary sigma factor